MRRLSALVVTVSLMAAAAVFTPAAAVAHTGPNDDRDHGRIAAPDQPGPYAVGRTTFSMVDPSRDGRTFSVDVWYPARARDVQGLAKSPIDLLLTTVDSPRAFDNPQVVPGAEFPLVVFSHGSGGIRFQSWFLMEQLASQGFIVAAPDHPGNTAVDTLFGSSTPFAVTARNRPLDVSLVITRMLERDQTAGDLFSQRIREADIAVMGHSFGGFTAIAAASGWADVPADPRVKAIVPIAAATRSFSDEQLASITVPSLWLNATSDITVPLDPNATHSWSVLQSSPRWRVDIRKAGHSSFANACEILVYLAPVLPADLLGFLVGQAYESCTPDLIPVADARRITNLTTVSFLKLALDHDARYRRYLGPSVMRDLPVDFFRG